MEDVLASGRTDDARWLPEPGGSRFWADPFAIQNDGGLEVLFEDFDYAHGGKGVISSVRLPEGFDAAEARPVAERRGHMSYPFLIEHEGEIYCLPETCEEQRLVLMRATRFPDQWEEVAVLLEGFPAVDATLFEYADRWWLFATNEASGASVKLYAWHAPSPLGPFEAHALNPIKNDVRSARPAGRPFMSAGQMMRPAQDCSTTYGGAITLNRIVALTPTTFEEQPAGRLAPEPDGPYPDGLHTVSSAGRVTVIDGKVDRFRLLGAVAKYRYRRALRRRASLPV